MCRLLLHEGKLPILQRRTHAIYSQSALTLKQITLTSMACVYMLEKESVVPYLEGASCTIHLYPALINLVLHLISLLIPLNLYENSELIRKFRVINIHKLLYRKLFNMYNDEYWMVMKETSFLIFINFFAVNWSRYKTNQISDVNENLRLLQ